MYWEIRAAEPPMTTSSTGDAVRGGVISLPGCGHRFEGSTFLKCKLEMEIWHDAGTGIAKTSYLNSVPISRPTFLGNMILEEALFNRVM